MSSKMKKWIWILSFFLLITFVVIIYLQKAVPPPTTSINFLGFTNTSYGTFAQVRFANDGKTTVYYGGFPNVEAETPSGWITNGGPGITVTPMDVHSTSNKLSLAKIPDNTIRWRAVSYFTYYKKPIPRFDFGYWMLRKIPEKRLNNSFIGIPLECVGWVLCQLPDPQEYWGNVATPWLTNQPPVAIKP
jgi:hypothetical protein